MPTFEVTSPDGKTYEVAGPEGSTKEQALAQVQKQNTSKVEGISTGERFVQGLKDPIDAGAQLLTHALPDVVVDAGNKVNNWLADKTGLVTPIPERNLSGLVTGKSGGLDQALSDQEKEYQARRKTSGSDGIDWARISGNVLSPANLAVASKIPAAVSLPGKLAAGAGAGATYGALQPVTGGDFTKEKLEQIGIGAAMGPVAELAGAGVARLVKPETREAVRKLMDEGITPTPGQILGGRWQVAEDKLTSVPIIGDAISSARGKGIDELNIAAYKRALAPIGGTVPKEAGRDAVASVRQQISDAYNNLLPKVQFKADSQFANDVQTLQQMAGNLPKDQAERFEKILRDNVIGKMTPQGGMDGATLKGIESQLGELSTGLKSDALFDNRQLGAALDEVRSAIRSNLERANPQYAKELKAANTSWANYVRIRDAASRQGAEAGEFTPSQLSAAVRAQDKSKGKRAFSEGDAVMQDLSDAGKEVLASKYPNSGTAGRTLLGLGTAGALGGGGALMPSIGVPAALAGAASMIPYLPGGRQAAAALLAGDRGKYAKPVADKIRQLSPAATPALLELLKSGAVQNQNQ